MSNYKTKDALLKEVNRTRGTFQFSSDICGMTYPAESTEASASNSDPYPFALTNLGSTLDGFILSLLTSTILLSFFNSLFTSLGPFDGRYHKEGWWVQGILSPSHRL